MKVKTVSANAGHKATTTRPLTIREKLMRLNPTRSNLLNSWSTLYLDLAQSPQSCKRPARPHRRLGVCDVAKSQDAINQAAGTAHWQAYQAAIAAGKTEAEAMQEAENARHEAVSRG